MIDGCNIVVSRAAVFSFVWGPHTNEKTAARETSNIGARNQHADSDADELRYHSQSRYAQRFIVP